MNKKHKLTHLLRRSALPIVFCCLTALWLRELTLRRSRESADRFMRPMIIHGHMENFAARFAVVDTLTDFEKPRLMPGWELLYDPFDRLVTGPLAVRVSLSGRVTGASHYRLNEFLAMPPMQGARAMWEWCENGCRDVEQSPPDDSLKAGPEE